MDYVDFATLGKTFYLMDTFAGLVDDQIGEDDRAVGRRAGGYDECYDAVVATFTGLPATIVRGAIPGTLTSVTTTKVAYLSIDMNCTPPEIAAMEYFWPKLVPGGVVVHDDYGFVEYEPQRRAFNDFAKQHGLEVLVLPTGQGLLFKPDDAASESAARRLV